VTDDSDRSHDGPEAAAPVHPIVARPVEGHLASRHVAAEDPDRPNAGRRAADHLSCRRVVAEILAHPNAGRRAADHHPYRRVLVAGAYSDPTSANLEAAVFPGPTSVSPEDADR